LRLLLRLREVFVLNVLLAILLGIAAGAGIADLIKYVEGEDIEMWAECQACMALVLVLMLLVSGLNLLNAWTVARLVGSRQALRALYLYALFPVIFLSIMLANASDFFLNVLIFGAPLLITGAVLLPYYAYILHSETVAYLRTITFPCMCKECGFRYLVLRTDERSECPRCRAPSEGAPAPVTVGQQHPLGQTAISAAEAGRLLGMEVMGEDWDRYYRDGSLFGSPFTGMDRTLLDLARAILVIPMLVAFWGGIYLVVDGIEYYPLFSEELFAGLLLLLGFAFSVPGIVRRPKGMWLKYAMVGAGLLIISGIGVGMVTYDMVIAAPFMLCAALSFAMLFAGAWLSHRDKPRKMRFRKR